MQAKKFLLLLVGFFPFALSSSCNFNSADYIQLIDKPSSIQLIEIVVPKSAKFNRNFAKIIVSDSANISPELKKKFKAVITVRYKFGSCSYEGTVKQNGDWKDHVALSYSGEPLRSLNIQLLSGNILNAVKFKLLLPETRANLNEVLGALVLRKLDFISPETFQVQTNINGVDSLMLFQEDARKELLERNKRREGPLFEGDESLLWSYEKFGNHILANQVLSRVTNTNWFLKGKNSEAITLASYERLQSAFLQSAVTYEKGGSIITKPNQQSDKVFEDFFFIMSAMNGAHGLTMANRKFYFNSFSDSFEPIYYDGDLNFLRTSNVDEMILRNAFRKDYKFSYHAEFADTKFVEDLYDGFISRVEVSSNEASMFFKQAIAKLNDNLSTIQSRVNARPAQQNERSDININLKKFIYHQQRHSLKQKILTSIKKSGVSYMAAQQNGEVITITPEEFIKIVSKHIFNGERYIYIPLNQNTNYSLDSDIDSLPILDGVLVKSKTLNVKIDPKKKAIYLAQTLSTDWALFKNINLLDWSISFEGLKLKSQNISEAQRFNKQGMTGCLNFYQTTFQDTSLSSKYAHCEDGINIVNSFGDIKEITVEKAYADAIDIDFSKVKINFIQVISAGNDCFDVSGGTYNLETIILYNCNDKGISVGEKSFLQANRVVVDQALIGVSSKDLSNTIIGDAELLNIQKCYETMQKKQEFGEARLKFNSFECLGASKQDRNVTIINNLNEL